MSGKLAVLMMILSTLSTGYVPLPPAQAISPGWHSLTGMLPAYTTIYPVVISPNSQYAVFIADIEVDDQYELYSVPISGTVPVKLNPPLVAGGAVSRFLLTPDSSHVIYTADQEVDERLELYSVPITGGQAVKLNGLLVSGGNVVYLEIDAHTGRVVYEADQQSNDVFELYSVPVEGGAFVKLNPTPTLGGDIYEFYFDPVSDRVVYTADQDKDDLYELYSVPITGGSSTKLSPPISDGVSNVEITPGAAYVMFIAKEAGANAYKLYGNDTTGGGLRVRSLPLNPGENVIGFHINPAGTLVVYDVATNSSFAIGNLYQTDPFTGDSQALSIADPGFGVRPYEFRFTPDGERIVCIYQLNAFSPMELQALSRPPSSPVIQVHLFVPQPGHAVGSFRISPDSQWVVYQDYLSITDSTLMAVPVGGGTQATLGSGADQEITPDSQRVIYRHPPHGDYSDVMSVQIFGGGERNLSRVQDTDYATGAQISPDGQWVVFQVQINGPSGTTGYQLRASDGTEAPLIYSSYLPSIKK